MRGGPLYSYRQRACLRCVWQVNLVYNTHHYLDFMEQFPERIYDICDLKIARRDLVKHRSEQEKVIAANEAHLHCAFSPQQFLEMNGGIDPAETAAENDDSFLARRASDPSIIEFFP
jgi:hypothetical protein